MTASAGPALKELYAEFSDRVAFVTLYVREAHPGERYAQATTFEQKLAQAQAYRDRDRIPWPVAVDTLDGHLHQQLDPKPNAAYLMDTHGNVAFRVLWSNDSHILRDALQAIVTNQAVPIGERESHVVPMLKGMGMMHDILSMAGQQAKQDVLRQAPPMYLLARLTALFRPLPPFGRGIAAMIAMLVGLLLAGGDSYSCGDGTT